MTRPAHGMPAWDEQQRQMSEAARFERRRRIGTWVVFLLIGGFLIGQWVKGPSNYDRCVSATQAEINRDLETGEPMNPALCAEFGLSDASRARAVERGLIAWEQSTGTPLHTADLGPGTDR